MSQKSNLAGIIRSLRNCVSRVITRMLKLSPGDDAVRPAAPSDGLARGKAKPTDGTWVVNVVRARDVTGRTMRIVTVADGSSVFSKTGPRSEHHGFDLVCLLERLGRRRGYPTAIRVDHGLEFQARDMHRWAGNKGIRLEFSSPGSRIADSSVERLLLLPCSRSEGRETAPVGSLSVHMRELLAYLRRRP